MILVSEDHSSKNWLEDRCPFKTRVSLCSFVQEFIGDPLDGVTLLLDLLRAVQLSQANQQTRCPPPVLRRALLDENSCLQCLRSCLRCPDAARQLSASPAGLFTLAVCIMSNVSKSRVLALEVSHVTCTPCHRHNWYRWRVTLLVTQWLASHTVGRSHNGWRVTLFGHTMVDESHCWSHDGCRVTLLVTRWLASHTVGRTMVGESH